ncbi:MAG TPA: GNAT family N-acetyltransferase [Pseudonocardiaceae bacterium]|nr:GNAT family N-acetyltransferase [Pseudonocardiaceae bacterium]
MTDLVSERLRLHPFTLDEGRRVVDGVPDAGDRWATGFPTQDDKDGVSGYVSAGVDPAPFGSYRIDLDGSVIGTIGFFGPPDERGEVTIGYGLVPGARGFGYATEAVARLVDFCRAHGNVRAVLADTLKDNVPSQRVLDKTGFVFVREAAARSPPDVSPTRPKVPATGAGGPTGSTWRSCASTRQPPTRWTTASTTPPSSAPSTWTPWPGTSTRC